jgi:uncharacterized protein YbjT (DUF2867 family)
VLHRERVRVLVRTDAAAEQMRALSAEPALGDLSDDDTLMQSLTGADRVFLNSAMAAIPAQKNLIDVAKSVGIRHIVKLSWIDTSRRPAAPPFARAHAEVESHLRESGIAYTILRATVFMQNHLQLLAGRGPGIVYGASGEGRASLVDARDVAAVAATVLTEGGHEGQVYEVTGPESLTKADAARIISKATGRQVRYINVSPDQMAENYHQLGWPGHWVDDLVAFDDLRKANRLAVVTDVVERLTGKKPTTFEEFVREFGHV